MVERTVQLEKLASYGIFPIVDQEFYQLLDKDGITDDIHLFNETLREWEDY